VFTWVTYSFLSAPRAAWYGWVGTIKISFFKSIYNYKFIVFVVKAKARMAQTNGQQTQAAALVATVWEIAPA
jgi:hypothetical protein